MTLAAAPLGRRSRCMASRPSLCVRRPRGPAAGEARGSRRRFYAGSGLEKSRRRSRSDRLRRKSRPRGLAAGDARGSRRVEELPGRRRRRARPQISIDGHSHSRSFVKSADIRRSRPASPSSSSNFRSASRRHRSCPNSVTSCRTSARLNPVSWAIRTTMSWSRDLSSKTRRPLRRSALGIRPSCS